MDPDRRARLEALGTVLRVHGLKAEMTVNGLRVVNPEAAGCCDRHPSDMLTVRSRRDDGKRQWFYTSWRYPIAETNQITDAVLAVKSLLDGVPGVSL